MKVIAINRAIVLLACMSVLSGCVQSGSRPSVWPSHWFSRDNTPKSNSNANLGSAAGVKGQLSSMGTAVSSAYGKAKSAVSSVFTSGSNSDGDPTSLSTRPASLGPEIYVANGQLYESSGNYSKALDAYSKALEIEPTNAAALLSMARLYNRQNELEKSAQFFKKASAVTPNDARIYYELGNLYVRQGQLAVAKEEYQKAIVLQPREREYRIALASVLVDEGQGNAAWDELAQVDPPALAHYRLGYIYFNKQNFPLVQHHMQAALQIDPNLQPARDILNQLGGGQFARQAVGTYQTVETALNVANSLFSTQPQAAVTAPQFQPPISHASPPVGNNP